MSGPRDNGDILPTNFSKCPLQSPEAEVLETASEGFEFGISRGNMHSSRVLLHRLLFLTRVVMEGTLVFAVHLI